MPDVVLPVLDEADSLPWVLSRMPYGYRPIVVDNCSTDASAEVARSFGALVIRQELRGFGAACHAGLRAATADVVCFMDADGSLDPRDLPSVADPVVLGSADLVLGARQACRGAWPLHARVANRLLVRRLGRSTGVHLTDIGPMRAAGRQPLLDLGIEDRRFGWPLEMVARSAHAGWRVEEVEVPYALRRGGRSKVTGTVTGTLRTVRDMAGVLRECT